MVQCVCLLGPRGLTNHLSPSGGTFNIMELINRVSVLTIHIPRVQRRSMVMLGDMAHSGGIQLSQGTAVLEVVDFLLVKVFLWWRHIGRRRSWRIYLTRLFLWSLGFLTLQIVILCLGMWVAMVMFHIIIAVDIIRHISWSISQRFRDYPP